jgi:hypothetical protein
MGRFALVALVVLMGCGSQTSSGVPGATTSASSARLTESPTPAPSLPAEVQQWSIHESSEYGYALRYPPTWFSLGHLGAPSTEAYFSNHKDAGSPMNLGADGVFIVLSADCQYWLGPDNTLVSKDQLTVGSVSVVRYVVSANSPDGNFYAADASVIANDSCYRLSMLGWSLSVV